MQFEHVLQTVEEESGHSIKFHIIKLYTIISTMTCNNNYLKKSTKCEIEKKNNELN